MGKKGDKQTALLKKKSDSSRNFQATRWTQGYGPWEAPRPRASQKPVKAVPVKEPKTRDRDPVADLSELDPVPGVEPIDPERVTYLAPALAPVAS